MRRLTKLLLRVLAVLVLCAAALAVFHRPLLRAFGGLLYVSQPPVHADAIVVLAGGWQGDRILKARELLASGHAPYLLISDPAVRYYGHSECRLALDFASAQGLDRARAFCVTTFGNSTREEAQGLVAELRRRGVRHFLLVTSAFHTARAAYVYRRAAPELHFTVVSSGNLDFNLERWWTTREGRKHVFFEATKHLAERLGL